MSGHGSRLTHKQELALASLLSEGTIARAAEKAGVPERTLKAWLTLPTFQSAYRDARTRILDGVVNQLLAATGQAVRTLTNNLAATRPADQVRSAVALLNMAFRGVEIVDLAERVATLEESHPRRPT